jgi:hypothetical protein
MFSEVKMDDIFDNLNICLENLLYTRVEVSGFGFQICPASENKFKLLNLKISRKIEAISWICCDMAEFHL